MNCFRRIQKQNVQAEKARRDEHGRRRALFVLRRMPGAAPSADEPEGCAEEKREEDTGERLSVNRLETEIVYQGGLRHLFEGPGEKEKRIRNGCCNVRILDVFLNRGIKTVDRGHVERIRGRHLKREADNEQDQQDYQKPFYHNIAPVWSFMRNSCIYIIYHS